MKALIISLAFLLIVSAQSASGQNEKNAPQTAIKLANAVMARYDSLIHYNNNKPSYGYDYAFLGWAIDKLGKYDQKYSDYMQAYIDYFVDENGEIKGYRMSDYNIDQIRPGLNMLELTERTDDKKYKIAILTLVEQIKNQPRTNSGGFWHKKRYPYQMWLDGLYMASPFVARYARDYGQPDFFDEVTFQIQEVYQRTLDKETGLVYHAWDESREQKWSNPKTGQSKHFWSRATGWYMMAMVDVLDYLPENHPQKDGVISILQKLSGALLKVQDEKTDLWYQVLDQGGREGNYLETSGSAMIIYAFAKGAKKGYLDKSYLKIADSAFDSLMKNLVVTEDDGLPVLTNVCGACGLGGNPYRAGDYNYYISEKRIDNDQKGMAPLILAAIVLNK
ncbi:glycoside hydrolase family 88/105 protein [Maribellus maritimus]|uniref:glycoside hydrolase family 88/105 protein n=1 Tax=Maribellus maritimus TaxID=2870838 RepID=UPI001EEC280C|nr:glycoside hydrolase family 88 protein [Maribellus maritimus]MCG6189870.1 glycoside hydrolase family 88 protein [Maribellus maritimus]